jgi:hypothetical protein
MPNLVQVPTAVGGFTKLTKVTLTPLNADAYDAGDVLVDTQEMANALRIANGTGVLQSLTLLDKADQAAAATTVVILRANHSLGTEDSAPDITDTELEDLVAVIALATTDWTDFGGAKIAFLRNLGIPVQAADDTASLYVGLITAGTPTQITNGLILTLGILCD